MRVSIAKEIEIDERLKLDKRKNTQAFCNYYGEELPIGFYELQERIRDGLEKVFWSKFPDRIDRSKIPKWKTPISKYFFFPAELLTSERIIIELSEELLGRQLVSVILCYLRSTAKQYCVVGSVHRCDENGGNYVGRFVITIITIVIEESLSEIWYERLRKTAI